MAELVGDLDLAEFDFTSAELTGEFYHDQLAALRKHGWLVKSPISYVVLDRESGQFFLRARQTRFPGKEIAELLGITGGRLAEQIEANILNLTGDRHRRLRALVSPAFTPRAAERWRPAMREIAAPARSRPARSPRRSGHPRKTRRRCRNGRAGCNASSTSRRWPSSRSASSGRSRNSTTT